MVFPDYFTEQDIMEFEYEYNRIRDIEEGVGFWEQNAECQIVAEEQRDVYYDELERDQDEYYEPDYSDSWYDEQYELEADYI